MRDSESESERLTLSSSTICPPIHTHTPQISDNEHLKKHRIEAYLKKRGKLDFSFVADIPEEPSSPMPVMEAVKVRESVTVCDCVVCT